MDQQALKELITLFLKLNPQPSDQQFHALAEACGVDKEELESIAYEMLGQAEDLLEDPISATIVHRMNANARTAEVMANVRMQASARLGAAEAFPEEARQVLADDQEVLDDPTIDPDDLNLTDVAMNDGDPTDDDLGQQEETMDDGYTENDIGVGLTNNVNDVLTDDGVPDVELP